MTEFWSNAGCDNRSGIALGWKAAFAPVRIQSLRRLVAGHSDREDQSLALPAAEG
jgi:hypothetical protein